MREQPRIWTWGLSAALLVVLLGTVLGSEENPGESEAGEVKATGPIASAVVESCSG